MRNVEAFYSDSIVDLDFKLKSKEAEINRISSFRLALAFLVLGGIYFGIAIDHNFYWASALFTVAFFFLVRKSIALSHQLVILQQVRQLNQQELEFIHGNKSVFDAGSGIDASHHLYALDLDIFGMGSLFQSINRTTTMEGRKVLIHELLNPPDQVEKIDNRSKSIIELEPLTEWRQNFYAIGALSGESKNDVSDFNFWIALPDFFLGKQSLLWLARTMTGFSIVFFLYAFYKIISAIFPLQALFTFIVPLLLLISLNTFLLTFYARARNTYFNQFGQRTKLFEKLAELFRHVSSKDFLSPQCIEIKRQASDASEAFFKLSSLSGQADQRLNGLMGTIMNGLYYFDVWSIRRIEKWKAQHQHHVSGWIAALAEMDMFNSMANFAFNHPSFCKPEILVDAGDRIVAAELGHPLMVSPIKNDYQIGLKGKAHIITGSNMAGKSTFIRAVGVNVILALNGLPVCAKSFSCSLLKVVACIRITDSLEEDASYFKAELTRLKLIINLLSQGDSCLVLLDEIMRGTNSDDKRNGTMAFYRKLKNYMGISLLATHDLEIGKLQVESPDYFENYCFESTIQGDTLSFDYKLHSGVSASTNATFLMRNLGLID